MTLLRLAPLTILFMAGCTSLPFVQPREGAPVRGSAASTSMRAEPEETEEERLHREMEKARAAVPDAPHMAEPGERGARAVWQQALAAKGRRIAVSRDARSLWLLDGDSVVFRAPVAVGKSEPFSWAGRDYDFTTPVGRRSVLAKATDPIWTPPDWHYFEIAAEQDLEVVQLRAGQVVELSDSTRLEVRGSEIGRVNRFGNFWPLTPGMEIIFDGKIFVPPFGTNQRKVPEVLGTHKLELGDGYLIHGTNQRSSIGDAVSHGCVRMFNGDVAYLFDVVPVGTPVYVF